MTKQQQLQKLIDATHNRAIALQRLLTYLTRLNARRRAELHAMQGSSPVRVRFGLDWAWGTMPVQALHKVGATFACRYLSHDKGKNLSLAESKMLHAAGIAKVVVWETTANRAAQGFSAGQQDARDATAQARACGMPNTRPIYYAVDFDANGPDVEAYFRGVASIMGLYRIGVYGGKKVISYLFNHKLVSWGWQTYAWSAGQWDPRAQIHQYSNGHKVGGVDCDYNRSVTTDFGQW